jgi:hypothetical protein
VLELATIDHADRTELLAEVVLAVARDDGDGASSSGGDDLDRHRPETTRTAPHEHRIAGLHGVTGPAVEHAIGGRTDKHVRRGLFPGETRRLGHALMILDLGELREAAPVRLVAPDLLGRGEHRILAGEHPRIVGLPHAAVNDDVVTDLDVLDVLASGPHDAARVGASDVKRLLLALLHAGLDHVDGNAHRGPHVVVVHPGGHHVDEDVTWAERGNLHGFLFERIDRLAESLGANQLRQHAAGNHAELGHVAELVQIGGARHAGRRHHPRIYANPTMVTRRPHDDLAPPAPRLAQWVSARALPGRAPCGTAALGGLAVPEQHRRRGRRSID